MGINPVYFNLEGSCSFDCFVSILQEIKKNKTSQYSGYGCKKLLGSARVNSNINTYIFLYQFQLVFKPLSCIESLHIQEKNSLQNWNTTTSWHGEQNTWYLTSPFLVYIISFGTSEYRSSALIYIYIYTHTHTHTHTLLFNFYTRFWILKPSVSHSYSNTV